MSVVSAVKIVLGIGALYLTVCFFVPLSFSLDLFLTAWDLEGWNDQFSVALHTANFSLSTLAL